MFESQSKRHIHSNPKLNELYNMYYYMLQTLTINRFEWHNLPKEIDPFFMEKALLDKGQVVFFRDDVVDKFAIMKTNLGGTMDIYDHPNKRFAYANQYFKDLNKLNSVLIRDNTIDYPTQQYIHIYAQSLANARMTRDLNVLTKRTPYILAVSDAKRLSVKNLMKMIFDFVPAIEIKQHLDEDISQSIQVLNLNSPDIYKDMTSYMREEINDFCNLIGIDSISGAKKERLITDEILQDSNQCYVNRYNYLRMRKRACEQINLNFGLNIDVSFVGATYTKSSESIAEDTREVNKDYGNVYN